MRLPAPARRQQLLDTALCVFAETGYHSTSMNDVAIAAGVTKPVLYQHFASKRELYLELLRDIGGRLRETITIATADADGPRRQIELGFDAYMAFVARHNDEFQVLFGEGTRRDEEFAREAREVEASIAVAVADLIEIDTLDPAHRLLLGNAIVGLAEGACRYWLRNDIDIEADALASHVSQLAWAGLRGIR